MTDASPDPPRYPHWAFGPILFLAVVVLAGVASQILPEGVFLAATPILVIVATILAVIVSRADARQTLLLRLPSSTDLLMAIPLTISFFILDDQISALSNARFPVPEDALDEARRLLTARDPLEWLGKIALIGVGAAVSEELMFRGFIQSAFLQRFRRPLAIALSAVLFMLLHIQYLPVLAAAIVLGYVTLATRSILIPMIVHFSNNVTQLLLFNLADLETLGDPIWIPPTILLPAMVMFALSWGYYLRRLGPEPEVRSGARAPDPSAGEPDRITIAHEPKSIADELSAVPESRRRLGWLVVAGAMLSGIIVLAGLFGWSVYYIYPERVQARGIEILERQVTESLEPDASDKAPEISSAFRALDALNERGQLELGDLSQLWLAHGEMRVDGAFDRDDADAFVDSIRKLVMERTTPQAL